MSWLRCCQSFKNKSKVTKYHRSDFFDLKFLVLYKDQDNNPHASLINASKNTLQASKRFCLNQLIDIGKAGCLNQIFAVELGTEVKLSGEKEMSKTFFQIQITDQLIDGKVKQML
jgi:hypothetical protein